MPLDAKNQIQKLWFFLFAWNPRIRPGPPYNSPAKAAKTIIVPNKFDPST